MVKQEKEMDMKKEKEKEKEMEMSPRNSNSARSQYTFLNSNVTIHHSKRPATTSFAGSGSAKTAPVNLSKDTINLPNTHHSKRPATTSFAYSGSPKTEPVNLSPNAHHSKRHATTSFAGSGSGSESGSHKTAPVNLSEGSIHLRLTSQDDNVSDVTYMIKRTAPLRKILEGYKEHHNLEEGSVKFLYDGKYCRGHQTPNDMGMEDEDEISVVGEQQGG